MLPSHCIGTRAKRFVVPPKFKAERLRLLWPPMARGGCRGRFRPRSAAVLPLAPAGRFQPVASLSVAGVVRVLLRHRSGYFLTILCDFATLVKRFRRSGRKKSEERYDSPGHLLQDPAPASRQWRYCWRRGCCCGRTGGRYSSPRRPGLHCWGH